MESLLYNINPIVYKSNANTAICFNRFNPRMSRNFTYVAALYAQNKGNTRLVKVQSKAVKMSAQIRGCVDSRDVRLVIAADKAASKMFRCGCGVC